MLESVFRRVARNFGYEVRRIVEAAPQAGYNTHTSFNVEDHYPFFPRPRWGHGLPPHLPLQVALEKGRENYQQVLREVEAHRDLLHKIKQNASGNSMSPFWKNGFFSCLDAASLVSLALSRKPKRYLEIGSGNSTLFARYAVTSGALRTNITSIDPKPRREVDAACDSVIRKPLEDCDLTLFHELDAGDFLFFDGTHRVFTNSDVTIFFLEVLPQLRPGVLVHVHDIFLPCDYSPVLNNRFYSEQYLLAAMLLCEAPPFRVVLPNYFVCTDPALTAQVRRVFQAATNEQDIPFFYESQPDTPGVSFWFEMVSSCRKE